MLGKNNTTVCQKLTRRVKRHIDTVYQDFTTPPLNSHIIDMSHIDPHLYQPIVSEKVTEKRNQGILINDQGCDLDDLMIFLRKLLLMVKRWTFYRFIAILVVSFMVLDLWVSLYEGEELLDKIIFTVTMSLGIGICCMSLRSTWKNMMDPDAGANFDGMRRRSRVFNNHRMFVAKICTMCTILYKMLIALLQLFTFYKIVQLYTDDDVEFTLIYAVMLMIIGFDQFIQVVRYLLGAFYDIYVLIHLTTIRIKFNPNEITKYVFGYDSVMYSRCDKSHHDRYDPPDYQSHNSIKYKIGFTKKSDYDQRFERENGATRCVDCESQIGKKHIRIIHATRLIDTRRIVMAVCCFILSYWIVINQHSVYKHRYLAHDHQHIFEMIRTMCSVFLISLIFHIITEVSALTYLLVTNKRRGSGSSDSDRWAMSAVRFCFSFSNDIILGCFTMFLRGIIDMKIHESYASPHCVLWLIGIVIGYFCQISAYRA